ncbi:MAG: MBL fold metallo-hydrolase [Gemmatimonadota bacterium]
MRLTFLGTGTSFGIPVVGCECAVCRSPDPRNRRTRHGLLVEDAGRTLLVDTPPELRLQLVQQGVRHLDGVYITHLHADHVHGLDDLRIFSLRSERALRVYVAAEYEEELRGRFPYIWGPDAQPEEGTTIPDLELVTFRDRKPLSVHGLSILPIAFPHGRYRSYGFRTGRLAVIVDAKRIPPEAVELLEDVEVLVINALWYGNPHPTHFNIEEAVEAAAGLRARRTYLTHLTHRLDHSDLERRLPASVRPAHDGLVVEV